MMDEDEDNQQIREEIEEKEEDWSHYFHQSDSILHAAHEIQSVPLSRHHDNDKECCLKVQCMVQEDLSPLDIVSNNNNNENDEDEDSIGEDIDSTGHHIWLASFFLIDFFILLFHHEIFKTEDKTLMKKINDDKISDSSIDVDYLLKTIFSEINEEEHLSNSKALNVMEVGCGCGCAGLSFLYLHSLLLQKRIQNNMNENERIMRLNKLVLTDGDVDAVNLCQSNYELNFKKTSTKITDDHFEFSTETLMWGSSDFCVGDGYDLLFGADIVYDLKHLPDLLDTVSFALENKQNGIFILSHIPRFASLDKTKKLVEAETVKRGLNLMDILEPDNIYRHPYFDETNDNVKLQSSSSKSIDEISIELKEKQSILFIFRKE